MLYDDTTTLLSTSSVSLISVIDEISSHEAYIMLVLVLLSSAALVLLFGEVKKSVVGLKRKSGLHPMLSNLPIDGLTEVITEYKFEPTRAGRILIVLSLVGLAKAFVYVGTVGLLVCAYVAQFFIREPQLGAGGIIEEEAPR